MEMEIIEGDITRVSADALVNAANNYLWMGGGVAGAIKKAGGKEIEEEAVRKGPIPVGEVVFTGPGRLPVKFIIHAAVMGQDLCTSAGIIERATANSLRKAEELGLKSIAFPALGDRRRRVFTGRMFPNNDSHGHRIPALSKIGENNLRSLRTDCLPDI